MRQSLVLMAGALVIAGSLALAEDPPARTYGWRGNWTGLYPDATVPAEWSNVSTGPGQGLRCTTTQPADGSDKDATAVEKGLPPHWLVIGPFPVTAPAEAMAAAFIPDEATAAPTLGQKVGDLEWRYAKPTSDSVSFWGVNAGGGKGQPNQAAYATTCLYARSAGRLRAVVEHVVGLKVYVNGQEVYADPQARTVMGSAYGQSRSRVANTYPVAPSFEFDVRAGWNRLTLKLVSSPRVAWNDLTFFLRLTDVPTVPYDRKNIVWMAPLADRSNATPIVVGEKVFVMVEPDELLCIDKNTGKVLWNAVNTYYDALPAEERDANPLYKEKIQPLADAVKAATEPAQRRATRKALYEALQEIDKAKFTMDFDGHLASHFEIVGFTTTPCSDGQYVYTWTGAGVAACYDLEGRRQWIRRFEDKLFYSASPALSGGTLGIFFRKMYGLDAKTGRTLWTQPEVNKTVASLLPGRLAGTDVLVSQQGEVVRAADGVMLWKNPAKIPGDTGWCAPLVLGDLLYVPWYGISQVFVVDFTGCSGDSWQPKVTTVGGITTGAPSEGAAGDPWMAASPLVHEGLLYGFDIFSRYFVVDLATRKVLAQKQLNLPGESSYVALRAAASPTLVGKYIVVMDNQGHAVTLEPGPECKEIARNNLLTQIPRDYPITTIELTSYSPPVPDGRRMYLRGERYLYCIGAP